MSQSVVLKLESLERSSRLLPLVLAWFATGIAAGANVVLSTDSNNHGGFGVAPAEMARARFESTGSGLDRQKVVA